MGSNISNEVKRIMQNALTIANTYNDILLRPEHVMASIIEDNESYPHKVLTSLGVDIIEFSDKLSEHLSTINLTPRLDTSPGTKVPAESITKQILNIAEVEANKIGSKVSPTHLLISILSVNSKSKELLDEVGVTVDMVKEEVRKTATNGVSFDDEEDDLLNNRKTPTKDIESKTPVLDNFCVDLTKAAKEDKLDPIVGRVVEIKRIGQILSRKKKNNPVIIGEAGVGKCVCPDSSITIRYKSTGEIVTLTVNDFKSKFIK